MAIDRITCAYCGKSISWKELPNSTYATCLSCSVKHHIEYLSGVLSPLRKAFRSNTLTLHIIKDGVTYSAFDVSGLSNKHIVKAMSDLSHILIGTDKTVLLISNKKWRG